MLLLSFAQVLPSFYCEDMVNVMNRERRREALAKFVTIVKADIERERKGRAGVENLAKALQVKTEEMTSLAVSGEGIVYSKQTNAVYVSNGTADLKRNAVFRSKINGKVLESSFTWS